MGLVQIILGKNIKKGFIKPEDAGKTDVISLELDATISESPEYNATPTRSEVESGANVSDHVTLAPETLTIEGMVSNTPIGVQQLLAGRQFGNPAQDAFLFLKKLYDERLPFDFVGGLKVYKSMVITNFSPSRTSTTGQALRFRMTMQQIKIVESEVVDLTQFSDDTKHTAQKKQDIGSQATEEATDKASQQKSSVYAKWFPGLFR